MKTTRHPKPGLPLLFHGTSFHRARRIVEGGFRRGSAASYTGTAVNLTESISIAWEYGPERCGKILAVTLDPQTRWRDAATLPAGQSYDAYFAKERIDALRTYGGNVWLLWTVERAQVCVLSISEVMIRVVAEFEKDGPDHGYNGDLGPISTLFWRGEAAAYAELRICAYEGFDTEAWKSRAIGRYQSLFALAGVRLGDGKATS
jgi:hypothetical protein